MDGRIKTRVAGSIPSTLGKQIGVMPIGSRSKSQKYSKGDKKVPPGGTDITEGRPSSGSEAGEWSVVSSARSSQLSSYSPHSVKDDKNSSDMSSKIKRSPSDRRVTKASTPPREGSAASDTSTSHFATPSGVETQLLDYVTDRTGNSARTRSSKPPSSSRTKASKTSVTSSATKNLTSPSGASLKSTKGSLNSASLSKLENIETYEKNSSLKYKNKSAGLKSSSSRSSAQSRTLKSDSRTTSSGSINTLTSQNEGLSDDGSDEEQDIKFFDVQSQNIQSSRANSKISNSARSKRGSATQRKQDNGKKPYKTIDPEEILAQNMESDFNKIYEINQHACELTAIDNLEKFKKLKVLDLSCNFIDQIQKLENNRELKELKLYDNRLRKVENLDCLKDLGSLQLQHNKIKTIGKGLSQLKKLQNLRIDCNQMLKIETPELSCCVQLKVLDISYNMLDNLAALNYLPNLEELNASGNRLRSVSDLSKCKHLQEVDLSRNRITDLSGLKGLPRLLTLNVSFNQIVSLKSIGKLKLLQDLFGSGNKIHDLSCLPNVIPKIEVLDLTDNEISDWDEMYTLEELPELVELFLSGNPFCAPDGPMPHYHTAITAVVPQLEIIDGAHIKKHVSKGAPLMRPMSASSIVSLRQMDSQMRNADDQMESLEKSLEEKFAALRATCDSLPAEPPRYHDFSFLNRPFSGDTSAASSRCSTRSRIRDAQAYAASTDLD